MKRAQRHPTRRSTWNRKPGHPPGSGACLGVRPSRIAGNPRRSVVAERHITFGTETPPRGRGRRGVGAANFAHHRAHASQRFVAGRHHTPGGRRRSPRFSNVWPHRQGRGKDAPTHPLVREPPGVTTFHVKPGAPGHGRLGGGTPNDGVASTAPHEAPTLPGHAGSTWNRRGLGRETAPHTARGPAAPGPQRRTREPTQPHHPLDPGGCKRGLTDLRPQGRSTSEPPGGSFT